MAAQETDETEAREGAQGSESIPERGPTALRWALIRDLTVFTAKAGLEAARDLALIPAALVAGIAGLLLSPRRPDRFFQEILEVGDRFDDFVDLFGREARRRRQAGALGKSDPDELYADDVFDRLEKLLVDEYNRGGVTAQAKEAIDRGLDAVQDALGSEHEQASAQPLAKQLESRTERAERP